MIEITQKKNDAWQLIWENPSPTSAFAKQNISMNLTNYSEFLVVCIPFVNITTTSMYTMVKGFNNKILTFLSTVNNRCILITDNGISFEGGKVTENANDSSCIPIKIYAR